MRRRSLLIPALATAALLSLLAVWEPTRNAVSAALGPRVLKKGTLVERYDLDRPDANPLFCTTVGKDGTIWDHQGKPGDAQVDNTGSSTTITDTGTGHPFTNVAVGDELLINVAGTWYPRGVIARASADSITVDEAIDLSADDYDFVYRDTTCASTAGAGWIYVGNLHNVMVSFNLPQYTGDGNGIDVRLQGSQATRDGYNNPTQLWPTDKTAGSAATYQNFTTAGEASNAMIFVPEPVEYIRFGMRHNTADDGTDTTTAAEQITVIITGEE